MRGVRMAYRCAACLGIGAALCTGVAWLCATRGDVGWDPPFADADDDLPAWSEARRADWPAAPDGQQRFVGVFRDVWFADAYEPIPGDEYHEMQFEVVHGRMGWPLRTHQWTVTRVMPLPAGTIFGAYDEPRSVYFGGLEPCMDLAPVDAEGLSYCMYRRLPLRPMWPDFAASTLGYAALLWGLWELPLAYRRGRRRRRGQCAGCGYDRAGIPGAAPCPECGRAP